MQWEDIKRTAESTGADVGLVFQEDVQKTILTALSRKELFNHLVFQGGTALRLFYGNPRFSEDLDFVTIEGKKTDVLVKNADHIQDFVEESYPFLDGSDVRIQKNDEIKRLVLKTQSNDLRQKLRVHIEAFQVPSYDNGPKILDHRPFHPSVRVESMGEILCDKLVALIGRNYIKGRDLWDVHYLVQERDISIDRGLVEKKLDDYGIEDIESSAALKRCKNEGLKALDNEMKRFLQKDIYRDYKERFNTIVQSSCELLDEATRRL